MRVALYLVVPAVTIGLSAVALATVAAPRTLVAARVWGGPTGAGGSVRLECVRRAVAIDDHVPLADVEVLIDGARTVVACDSEGTAEVRVAPGKSPRHVVVRARGATLVEGDASVSEDAWQAKAITTSARLRGGGKLAITALVDGGALAMGQRGQVLLRTPEDLRTPASATVTATGAEVKQVRAATGGLMVDVVPAFPTASLEVARAGAPPESGGWEAPLPVAPAAITLEQVAESGARVTGIVRAPTERARAYVVLQDLAARLDARVITMRPDGRGGSLGELVLDAPGRTSPAWIVAGSDPTLSSAIAWPLGTGDGARDGRRIPDARWLDGMTPMHAKERGRSGRLSFAIAGLVALGAVLEALLLLDRARRSRRELAAHVARFADGEEQPTFERDAPILTIVIALAAILFGFVTVGVVFLLKA